MDVKTNDIYKTTSNAFGKYVYSESEYTLWPLPTVYVYVLSEIDAVPMKTIDAQPSVECEVNPC
jgi:hypothetical protein